MNPSEAMNSDLSTLGNVVLKPLALDVTNPLSLTEWRDIGRQFATAMRTVAFVIGIAAPAAMQDALRDWRFALSRRALARLWRRPRRADDAVCRHPGVGPR
jgi:hypothetical protein